jgi:predicted flap endonuclease-1-like 5' DNA nuclease
MRQRKFWLALVLPGMVLASPAYAQGQAAVITPVDARSCSDPRPASPTAPDEDDLTRIKSIDAFLSRRLKDLGIIRFEQIAGWNQEQTAEMNGKFEYKYRIEKQNWRRQAKQLSVGKSTTHCEKFNSSKHSPSQDRTGDDLRCIKGITRKYHRILKESGFRSFADLGQLSDGAIRNLAIKLDMKARIEEERWIAQASTLHGVKIETKKQAEIERRAQITTCRNAMEVATYSEGRSLLRFDSTYSIVKLQSAAVIDRLTAAFKQSCQLPSIRLSIEGHTDSDAARKDNQLLSEQRAQAVVNHLSNGGIGKDQACWAGFAASKPAVPNDSIRNKAINRRVEVQLEAW